MVDSRAAKRYSHALFALALGAQAMDAIEQDLRQVGEAVTQTPDFLLVMQQPRIHQNTKKEIVRHAFEGRVSPTVLNFLCLLVDRKRVPLIEAILADFTERVRAWRNQAVAEVTTAIPITDAERQMFVARLGQITGKMVQLTTRVDPSIIGGARVHIGGKMIDGTVATHLERIRERFKQVRVT